MLTGLPLRGASEGISNRHRNARLLFLIAHKMMQWSYSISESHGDGLALSFGDLLDVRSNGGAVICRDEEQREGEGSFGNVQHDGISNRGGKECQQGLRSHRRGH